MLRHLLLLITGIIFLASCSLSPIKVEPSTNYVLNTVPSVPIKKNRRRVTLLVTQVQTDPLNNTTDMAYSVRSYEVAYFAKSRWGEPPAEMLQPLIVQTLQNTQHFYAVSSSPALGHADFVLNTQLLELRQVFYANSSVVRLKLRAQIINSVSNRVVATRQFFVVETAPQNTPYGGVVAANRATANMLRQLAGFCLQKL